MADTTMVMEVIVMNVEPARSVAERIRAVDVFTRTETLIACRDYYRHDLDSMLSID
jgi:hypothetical protein